MAVEARRQLTSVVVRQGSPGEGHIIARRSAGVVVSERAAPGSSPKRNARTGQPRRRRARSRDARSFGPGEVIT